MGPVLYGRHQEIYAACDMRGDVKLSLISWVDPSCICGSVFASHIDRISVHSTAIPEPLQVAGSLARVLTTASRLSAEQP